VTLRLHYHEMSWTALATRLQEWFFRGQHVQLWQHFLGSYI